MKARETADGPNGVPGTNGVSSTVDSATPSLADWKRELELNLRLAIAHWNKRPVAALESYQPAAPVRRKRRGPPVAHRPEVLHLREREEHVLSAILKRNGAFRSSAASKSDEVKRNA